MSLAAGLLLAASALAPFCGAALIWPALAQQALAQKSPSAAAPPPDAMATQADPGDFVGHADGNLLLQGAPIRFAGLSVSWLGLRDEAGTLAAAHPPADAEVQDALGTVQAMGAGYVRALSLGASAGCAQCLLPGLGGLNPDALRHADHVIKQAHDAGVKLIIPLAGPGAACTPAGVNDPVFDTPCIFAGWRGKQEADFFTDPQIRADFAQFVTSVLRHVNPETGLAYKDDPTIMAWENCAGCGAQMDVRTLADWTEFLGRTIKVVDTHHLYENGAFAGRFGKQAGSPGAAQLALSSVDIVGDRISSRPGASAERFSGAMDAVTGSGRAYVIDDYDWSPATYPTEGDLIAFHDAAVKDRNLTAAFTGDIGAHAAQGGYLPPARPGLPTLYFPGIVAGGIGADAMQARARAVRRFSYRMMDIEPIAFSNVDAPEILSVIHGKLRWRGSPGALKYSIERSSDITTTGSWQNVCDQCASDINPEWQDPVVPSGPIWYRIIPYNSNLHAGLPSFPAQSR